MIAPLTPERYRLQFTVSKGTHDMFRRVQDLLCREIPDGDPAVIFERALNLLAHDVEKKKLAATTKPRPRRGTKSGSRDVPAHVRRAVWKRDGGRRFDPSIVREAAEMYGVLREIAPFRNGDPAAGSRVGGGRMQAWISTVYAAGAEVGAVTRASRSSVINVSAGGGSVPTFVVG